MEDKFKELLVEYWKVILIVTLLCGVAIGAVGYPFITKSQDEGKSPNSQATAPSTQTGSGIVVDVSGAVKKPGVTKLSSGSRLYDLISAAGGFDPLVSVAWVSRVLNLSQQLKDSQKIYIPFEYDFKPDLSELELMNLPTVADLVHQSSSTTKPNDNLINVNTATQAELNDLPGVGDVTSQKIISNRPYADEAEFKSKSGVTSSVFEKIKSLITY